MVYIEREFPDDGRLKDLGIHSVTHPFSLYKKKMGYSRKKIFILIIG